MFIFMLLYFITDSTHCKLPANYFCYIWECIIGFTQVKYAISRDTKYYQAYKKFFGILIGEHILFVAVANRDELVKKHLEKYVICSH